MRIISVLVIMVFIASCVTNPGVCRTAPKNEGWVHIEAPPKEIVVTDRPSWGYYFEWFAKDSDLILRCERSKKGPGCGESAAVYIKNNDDWLTDGLVELIVCAQ